MIEEIPAPPIEPPPVIIDDEVIYVHILPHSHNDAGWNMPYEGYYSWATSKILSNVVDHLYSNPHTTFNWADTSFLSRWWGD